MRPEDALLLGNGPDTLNVGEKVTLRSEFQDLAEPSQIIVERSRKVLP